MKVLCINDTGRPNEVPLNKWITKGTTYTVVHILRCNSQGGSLALILEEIDLKGCEPFEGFNALRFVPLEGVPELVEKKEEEVTV